MEELPGSSVGKVANIMVQRSGQIGFEQFGAEALSRGLKIFGRDYAIGLAEKCRPLLQSQHGKVSSRSLALCQIQLPILTFFKHV